MHMGGHVSGREDVHCSGWIASAAEENGIGQTGMTKRLKPQGRSLYEGWTSDRD